MHKYLLFLFVSASICSHFRTVETYGFRIPIGVIVGSGEEAALTAIKLSFWRYESFNGGQSPFSVQLIEEYLQSDDIVTLSNAVCQLMRKGVFLIIAKADPKTYSTLISFSNRYQIPLISPAFPEVNWEYTSTFGFAISPPVILPVLDFMRYNNWNSLIYIYSSDDGSVKLQRILELSAGIMNIDVLHVKQVNSSDEVISILYEVEKKYPLNAKNVILDVDAYLAMCTLVRHAHSIHLQKNNYHYLLMQPVTEDFWQQHMNELRVLTITGFQLFDSNSPSFQQFMTTWLNLRSEHWIGAGRHDVPLNTILSYDGAQFISESFKNFLNQIKDPHHFTLRTNGNFKDWNISQSCIESPVNPWENGRFVAQYLKQTHVLSGITGNIQFTDNGQRKGYSIDIIETTGSGFSKIGTWSDISGIRYGPKTTLENPEAAARSDNEKIYKVTSILVPPYLMLKDESSINYSSGNNQYKGFCKDLVDLLENKLNVKLKIQLVEDGTFGKFNKDTGKWNGMIGELIRGKADMAIAPMMITDMRQKVVDFGQPFQNVGISLMVKKPSYLGTGQSSSYFFLHAFSSNVWFVILAVYIIISVLVFAFSKVIGAPDNIQSASLRWENKFSVLGSLWFSIGAMLFQGTAIYPRSISSRLLSATWFIFTILLISLYIGNLTSLIYLDISQENSNTKINSLISKSTYSIIEESLSTGQPEIGILNIDSLLEIFQTSLYSKYSNHVLKNPQFIIDSAGDGVEKVRSSHGYFALFLESTVNEYFNHQFPCDTLMIHSNLDTKGYGIAFPLFSSFRTKVDAALSSIIDAKELDHLYKKWWSDNICSESKYLKEKVSSSVMSLANIAGLFYLFISALLLGGIITTVHYFIKTKKEESGRDIAINDVILDKTPMPLPDLSDDNEDLPLPPPPMAYD